MNERVRRALGGRCGPLVETYTRIEAVGLDVSGLFSLDMGLFEKLFPSLY